MSTDFEMLGESNEETRRVVSLEDFVDNFHPNCVKDRSFSSGKSKMVQTLGCDVAQESVSVTLYRAQPDVQNKGKICTRETRYDQV
jgi:hypothetical protein